MSIVVEFWPVTSKGGKTQYPYSAQVLVQYSVLLYGNWIVLYSGTQVHSQQGKEEIFNILLLKMRLTRVQYNPVDPSLT